ncbi:hypothetical protein DICVIV_00345 [Dictyocaulus viviparus]|uniref:Uncharacterized protein n=1 Tax=Dictyocaulus viviparus TaxID=29172 RepID=A0A0D8YB26_DICVI|nr:hypothetical protein DICVIV_00345 [Dictyocaulus viviparus]
MSPTAKGKPIVNEIKSDHLSTCKSEEKLTVDKVISTNDIQKAECMKTTVNNKCAKTTKNENGKEKKNDILISCKTQNSSTTIDKTTSKEHTKKTESNEPVIKHSETSISDERSAESENKARSTEDANKKKTRKNSIHQVASLTKLSKTSVNVLEEMKSGNLKTCKSREEAVANETASSNEEMKDYEFVDPVAVMERPTKPSKEKVKEKSNDSKACDSKNEVPSINKATDKEQNIADDGNSKAEDKYEFIEMKSDDSTAKEDVTNNEKPNNDEDGQEAGIYESVAIMKDDKKSNEIS